MLKSEIKDYMDADGLVSPSRTFPGQRNASGNGVLYTSEYYITLRRRGDYTNQDDMAFLSAIDDCFVEPGLLKRGPIHGDQEGPDDYVGICAASALLHTNHAKQILLYGQGSRTPIRGLLDEKHAGWKATLFNLLLGWIRVRYNYNNVTPGKMHRSSWMGRQPQLIAHMHFAAGERPPLWMRLYWCLAVVAASRAPAHDQDAWMLTWLLIRTAERKSRLCALAARHWWKKAQETLGTEGMQNICAKTLAPGHPLGKYFVL